MAAKNKKQKKYAAHVREMVLAGWVNNPTNGQWEEFSKKEGCPQTVFKNSICGCAGSLVR